MKATTSLLFASLLLLSGCVVIVPRDETLSSRLRDWKIMGERGNPEAQYNFGWYLYQSATSVEDEQEALSWFDKAARQGVAEAQFALATMLERGKGMEKGVETLQIQQARYWYRQAADAGLAAAQHNLGTMYARGDGVAVDDERAFQWFFLAAVQEYLPARKALRAITKRMSAEERVRARARVKAFLKQFPNMQKAREGKVYAPPV